MATGPRATVATRYAAHEAVAAEIGRRLIERLDYVRISPHRVLDAGCGIGTAQHALHERYPQATVLGLDRSPEMLAQARAGQRRLGWFLPRRRRLLPVCADAGALPLATGCLDLVWSNLLLPVVAPLTPVIAEWHRVMAPGALLMFASLGPDSLRELRQAVGSAGSPFPDMHDVGDALLAAGFADPVMDMETLTLTYPDLPSLTRERRALRGRACPGGHPGQGLRGRSHWAALGAAYPLTADGRWPLTVEVVYGHAWKPLAAASARAAPGAPVPVTFHRPGAGGRVG